MNYLWEAAERANNNSKGMLREFENGERTLDEKEIVRYKNRSYENLDDEAKANIIKIAKIDISNILSAMKPAKNELSLYQIIFYVDILNHSNFPRYDVNDIVEFKNITEASITPYLENESEQHFGNYQLSLRNTFTDKASINDFYRYEIIVPENGFILKLDDYEEYSQNWY
jgi:hypothetical protein